jgi:hypothetical protein
LIVEMISDQGVQRRDPSRALLEAAAHQPTTPLIDDLDVVVILGPVISDEQHQPLLCLYP